MEFTDMTFRFNFHGELFDQHSILYRKFSRMYIGSYTEENKALISQSDV